MKFYVVLDTNVIVSAALKMESNPGILLKLVDEGIIVPLVNQEILDEYELVLKRPKFHFNEELINIVLKMIVEKSMIVEKKELDIQLVDQKDKVFYEVVMAYKEKRNSYLATGNLKHFPETSYIVSPRIMCEIILAEMEKSINSQK